MKILMVSYDYRPRLGGVATCAFELAMSFNRQAGVKVHVLSAQMRGDKDYDHQYDIQVTRVNLSNTAIKAVFPLYLNIKKIVEQDNPDLIINMLWMPSGIATLLFNTFSNSNKIPYYVFAHGVEILESHSTLKKRIRSFISPIKNLVFKKARKVFCVSHFTKQLILENCSIKESKVKVVYNGVNPEYFINKFKDERLLNKYHIKNQKVFLTITRLDDYKGVDNAIIAFSEVFKINSNFIYLIGGVGNDKERLLKLIAKYNLQDNIILCGRIPDNEIVDYYNLADTFVLLSRYDHFTPNVEGFGLVFLEAAACMVPSVAGDSGGIRDAVIHDEGGILVDPESIEDITMSFLKMLEDKEYLKKLSDGAYKNATQNMTWDQMSKRVLKEIK